jgi:hypothetical protein
MDKYKVYTWGGSGYFTNEYIVEGDSDEEAIYNAIDLAVLDGGIMHRSDEEAFEMYNEDDDKDDYHDYHDYMEHDGWHWCDNSMEGGFVGYVCLENLRVEKVEEDYIEE